MIFKICVLALMIICCVNDIRMLKVPYWEIGLGGALSFLKVLLDVTGHNADPAGMLLSLLPGILLLITSCVTRGGIGKGDGLLCLALGPSLGPLNIVMGLLIAFFISGVFSAVVFVRNRYRKELLIPFVPFMTLGMGVMMFVQV